MLALLGEEGFVPDGDTRTETVRVPTMRSPVFGGSGGELHSFGGRQRLRKPGTDLCVTVGPRTTFLYRALGGGKVESIFHERTSELEPAVVREAIKRALLETEGGEGGEEEGGSESPEARPGWKRNRFAEASSEDRREWALEDKYDLKKEGG